MLKLKVELSYDLEIPTPGHVSRQNSHSERHLLAPLRSSRHLTTAKTWKQPERPMTDEWTQKMQHGDTVGCYSAIKENEIMPLSATWMDQIAIITLQEVRERQVSYHVTYM